jgi:hypothetical protein
MKKNNLLFPILFSVIFTVIIYACKDENIISPTEPRDCNISTSIHTAPSIQLPCTVVYRAEKTGTVSVSKLSFRDDNGLQILNNPTLPFDTTFILNIRDTVSMSAESVVTGGQISIVLWAKSQTGSTVSDTIKCGN